MQEKAARHATPEVSGNMVALHRDLPDKVAPQCRTAVHMWERKGGGGGNKVTIMREGEQRGREIGSRKR